MTEVAASPMARKALLLLLAVYALAVFLYQVSLVVDPAYLHEEMRLLFRYRLLTEPEAFAGDYISRFVAAFAQPYLYEGMTRLWLWAGGDLTSLHRAVPLLCWLVFLAGLAVAARRLGDRITQVAVLCLAVVQPVYLHQITSALPHSFAFPLLAWAFVALLSRATAGLALVTLLTGLLYPALVPLVGLLFAWHVLVCLELWHKSNIQRVANLALLAAMGGIALWLLHHALSGPTGFGAALAPLERVDSYPENGPGGRHFYGVFNPFAYVAAKGFDQFHDVFGRLKLLLLLVCGLLSAYGGFVVCREKDRGRAVLGVVLCSLLVSLLVLAVKPHLVYRFVLYPGFTLLPLLFVCGVEASCERFAAVSRAPRLAALGAVLLFALTLDGVDARKLGYGWHLEPGSARIFAFAAEQPPGTTFAAWPQTDGGLEYLPYLAGRPVFVLQKAHYPSYEGHILAMRARMEALTEAYLAIDEEPLRRLHCRWGVDYLIVDRSHFTAEGARPSYFAPFDAPIERLWESRRATGFLLQDPDPHWIVLATERHLVLQLPGPCEPD